MRTLFLLALLAFPPSLFAQTYPILTREPCIGFG